MSCSSPDDDPDDPVELADFDAGLSEQRGERDIALFFDQRLMNGVAAEAYVARAMDRVGGSFQGRWTRFGYYRCAEISDEMLRAMLASEVFLPEGFQFPGTAKPLVVAQLEGIRATALKSDMAKLDEVALVVAADITFLSELRVFLSRTLDWL